jgi:hypothetical protein
MPGHSPRDRSPPSMLLAIRRVISLMFTTSPPTPFSVRQKSTPSVTI